MCVKRNRPGSPEASALCLVLSGCGASVWVPGSLIQTEHGTGNGEPGPHRVALYCDSCGCLDPRAHWGQPQTCDAQLQHPNPAVRLEPSQPSSQQLTGFPETPATVRMEL